MAANNKLKEYEKTIITWCKSVQGKYKLMKIKSSFELLSKPSAPPQFSKQI